MPQISLPFDGFRLIGDICHHRGEMNQYKDKKDLYFAQHMQTHVHRCIVHIRVRSTEN